MKKSTCLLLVALGCSSGPRLPRAPQGEVVLEVRGAVKGGPYRLGREDLEALPRRKVVGIDPATGRRAEWEGPELATLASTRVELARGADTLVLRTSDRRAVIVPLTLVRQFRPVLADRADGQRLDERVVAWPNVDQLGLRSDPRARAWWARELTALELVNGWAVTRALAVPPGAAEGARRGSDVFGARCLACHRMRKAGGEKGPDLTRVADRMPPDRFSALLPDHPGWHQPGLEPLGARAMQDVYAFLRAVAVEAASGPVDEPPEPAPGRGGDEGQRPPTPPGGY